MTSGETGRSNCRRPAEVIVADHMRPRRWWHGVVGLLESRKTVDRYRWIGQSLGDSDGPDHRSIRVLPARPWRSREVGDAHSSTWDPNAGELIESRSRMRKCALAWESYSRHDRPGGSRLPVSSGPEPRWCQRMMVSSFTRTSTSHHRAFTVDRYAHLHPPISKARTKTAFRHDQ